MKKKSHVKLIEGITNDKYRLSFLIGSILPDIEPSFVYKRHTIDRTIGIVEREMHKIYWRYFFVGEMDTYIARHIGIVSHYISDYFTYPHTTKFSGSLREHTKWEANLQEYIYSHGINRVQLDLESIGDTDIIQWIKDTNNEYLQKAPNIENDYSYIVEVNIAVLDYILAMETVCELQRNGIKSTLINI